MPTRSSSSSRHTVCKSISTSRTRPTSLSLFLVSFLRAGDAGGGNATSTKEVTAGRGAADPANSHRAIVEGGSQCPEQSEEGGDTQADRRARETQGQPAFVPGQSSG